MRGILIRLPQCPPSKGNRGLANECSGWRRPFISICTEQLSPAERLPTWHDVFGRSVSRRILSPLSDDLFHVNMTVRRLATGGSESHERVCVQHMTLTAGFSAQRTTELLADGNDDIVLHIHEAGRRAVSQLGREATAEPFTALLTSNADHSTIILPEPARFFSIGLPRRTMKALVPGIEDALLVRYRTMPALCGCLSAI